MRLVVEALDLHVAGRPVHRDRLGQRAVGVEADAAAAALEGAALELGEQAPAHAQAPGRRGHPHPLDLDRLAASGLQGAATDRLAPQGGHEEGVGVGRQGGLGVEAGREARSTNDRAKASLRSSRSRRSAVPLRVRRAVRTRRS
jgi:hypothetical protein